MMDRRKGNRGVMDVTSNRRRDGGKARAGWRTGQGMEKSGWGSV